MPRYAPPVTALSDRLAARTLELVDIPSQSEDECAIREHLLTLVPPTHETEFAGDEAFLFVPERRPGVELVVLAGHYDTVPPQGNLPGRVDGDVVHGLGSSDMKGGLAVALELVRDLPLLDTTAVDVALLLFGREELPAERNPLPALFAGSRAVHDASLAIVLEPTSCRIQAGCLGNVVARLTFHGTSGHAARPWLADSALERAIAELRPLLELEPREAAVGDLTFVEVVSLTRLESGIADNVIPGEATATLNFRYAPDRSADEAEAYLRALVPAGATLKVVGNAPAARVATGSALVEALRAAGDPEIQPKQAWTNVADFTARGIDAVNLGPGDPALAHHADEHVAVGALVDVYETLRRFVTGAVREDAA
jgi:succinyl-diaminopimelate desuccinylase